MSDKWDCRLHPKGRCLNSVFAEYGDLHNHFRQCWAHPDVYALTSVITEGFSICPWPSRQKDAPPRKTNLEVAVDEWYKTRDIPGTDMVWAILKAVGVDPDAPAPERE